MYESVSIRTSVYIYISVYVFACVYIGVHAFVSKGARESLSQLTAQLDCLQKR